MISGEKRRNAIKVHLFKSGWLGRGKEVGEVVGVQEALGDAPADAEVDLVRRERGRRGRSKDGLKK
jgi:hypothetical protein